MTQRVTIKSKDIKKSVNNCQKPFHQNYGRPFRAENVCNRKIVSIRKKIKEKENFESDCQKPFHQDVKVWNCNGRIPWTGRLKTEKALKKTFNEWESIWAKIQECPRGEHQVSLELQDQFCNRLWKNNNCETGNHSCCK